MAAGQRTSAPESAVALQLPTTSSLEREVDVAASEQQGLRARVAAACRAPGQAVVGKVLECPVEELGVKLMVKASAAKALEPAAASCAATLAVGRAAGPAGHRAH